MCATKVSQSADTNIFYGRPVFDHVFSCDDKKKICYGLSDHYRKNLFIVCLP